ETMEFIYPKDIKTVFLPKDFNEKTNDLILKVAHSKPNTKLYWYLDNKFLGETSTIHNMAIQPNEGEYLITVTDEYGNEIKRFIEISH
ncbi:MAG TPA: penicillin-binding protein 1C, partial [Flavobacteriaceae bacterium]|nr:penicillin-binding protein 1C [Flavobacteriaceae bacterium]